jgi:hypothetical protein
MFCSSASRKGKADIVRLEWFTVSSPVMEVGTLTSSLKTGSRMYPMGVSSQTRV